MTSSGKWGQEGHMRENEPDNLLPREGRESAPSTKKRISTSEEWSQLPQCRGEFQGR